MIRDITLDFNIQDRFFSKLADYCLYSINNHVYLSASTIQSGAQMRPSTLIFSYQHERVSSTYQSANMKILSIMGNLGQNPSFIVCSENEEILISALKEYDINIINGCNIAIHLARKWFVSVSFNQNILTFHKNAHVCAKTPSQLKITGINHNSRKLTDLIVFYNQLQEEEMYRYAEGMYLYDIEWECLKLKVEKQHWLLSTKSILYENNIIINGYLNQEDNSSYLKAYDFRTRSTGIIIDSCQTEYPRYPHWKPNYKYFSRFGEFGVGTIWGNGGLRSGEIAIIDIRKPFSKIVINHKFHHLRYYQLLPKQNGESELWTVENTYQDYRYTGNSITRLKDI